MCGGGGGITARPALVLDSGRRIRDVGRELGVNHETLRNWVAQLRQEPVQQGVSLAPDTTR
ncbi:hypothetical protein GCM10011608_54530 [Micromonospora sonchi]|uniref:Transposase n=1 Tax=Micromonospora sonchi TaxID=1763543 RepID=A0A917U6J3_9ACTN|nr:hypothetical protein GCM10011608_54530 [Micromonospora sonchi]